MKGPTNYQQYQQYHGNYRYYQADTKHIKMKVQKHLNTFKKVYNLLKNVDDYTMGTGVLGKPARTCRELFENHPSKPSGTYWTDPNEGSTDDAVLVQCVKASRETCVFPKLMNVSLQLL